MKMLTIHHHRSVLRSDFCWGVEGEIAIPGTAIPGFVCSTPNTECGCDRSHRGLSSHASSTTVMVSDLDLTLDDLTRACVGYLEAAGYLSADGERSYSTLASGPADVESWAYGLILEAVGVAAKYPVGTVLRMAFDRDSEQWNYCASPRQCV